MNYFLNILLTLTLLVPGVALAVTAPTCANGQAPVASFDSSGNISSYACEDAAPRSTNTNVLIQKPSAPAPQPQPQSVQTASNGACQNGVCSYVPLEPLPGVNQTGLDFAGYISAMFRLFITLGALFAVLMLVLAGISWMTSESPLKLTAARERATSALYGLLLLVACWLILYTINPNLLRFDLFTTTLNTTAQKNTTPGEQPSGGNSAVPTSSTDKNTLNAQIAACEGRGVMRPDPNGILTCYPNL